jgi:peptide/nickel transport system permease protein
MEKDMEGVKHKGQTSIGLTFRRLRQSPGAVFGLVIVTLLFLTAIFADLLAPSGYAQMHDELLAFPSGAHLMGTDMLGRDQLSRVIYGSRVSIYVGLVSIVLAILLGVPLGLISGYYGGIADNALMRVMDIWMAFPVFLLAILIMVILEPSVNNVILAIAIVRVPTYARLVRGSVLSVKEREYIEAARAVGVKDWLVLFRHILPNCLAPVIVVSTLSVANAIIVEASLSFLGLGTQPPTPSWGWDLKANLMFIEVNPWIVLFPGLAIFLTVLGFNMLGDGLRDTLDPRLKQ